MRIEKPAERLIMISPGDLLVFIGVVGIMAVYLAVLHHFISQSEKGESPGDSPDPKPNHPDDKQHD